MSEQVLYGVKEVRVRALNPDLTINSPGLWRVIDSPQEIPMEPQYIEGNLAELNGGDDSVSIIEEANTLESITMNFKDAVLTPEDVVVLAGGTVLYCGSSTAQNAIDPVTTPVVVDATHVNVKLAVDGGAATDVAVAIATYSTWATLLAAINAAIQAGPAAVKDKVIATYVPNSAGTGGKLKFVSVGRLQTSTVIWTAGTTNDLGTNLGRGTPVAGNVVNGWRAPAQSAAEQFQPFEMEIYVARYESDPSASITGYMKFSFFCCEGHAPTLTASAENWVPPTFTVKGKENPIIPKPVYEWDEVANLPA